MVTYGSVQYRLFSFIPNRCFLYWHQSCCVDFLSPFGLLAIGSLNVLPVWLCALRVGVLASLAIPLSLVQLVTLILIVGRLICAIVEVRDITLLQLISVSKMSSIS